MNTKIGILVYIYIFIELYKSNKSQEWQLQRHDKEVCNYDIDRAMKTAVNDNTGEKTGNGMTISSGLSSNNIK